MAKIYKCATSKIVDADCGVHAEVISDGARAVLSLFHLKSKVWSMAIIEPATHLASNADCLAFAIQAAGNPKDQNAVTEAANEAQFERCLALEEALQAASRAPAEVDVDDEEDDTDNSYL
jgi:hypothetical protein